MNEKLMALEDSINEALDSAHDELEIVEVIGLLELKKHVILARFTKISTDDPGPGIDPADWWKILKK